MKLRAVLALVMGFTAVGVHAPARAETTRLALLASDSAYLYWSPDASDPEAPRASVTRTCSYEPIYGTGWSDPCLSGPQLSGFIHTLFFHPAGLLEAPLGWDGSAPARYHVEVAAGPAPFTVHFVVQSGGTQVESAAATETAPGVFEGTVPPIVMTPAVGNLLGVRIRTATPAITITIRTRGRSYLETSSATVVRSVPELRARSTYAPAPSTFATPQREWWFNDGAWSVRHLTGDLAATRSFDVDLAQRASVVFAWIEMYDAPVVHDAVRRGALDSSRVTDAALIKILRNGVKLDGGVNYSSMHGRGMDSVGLVNVSSGRLTVQVSPATSSRPVPYDLYVLVTTDERTISRMRWRFALVDDEPLIPHRSPISAFCPTVSEPIPVTSTVTTYAADLRWDSVNPMREAWTWRFSLPGVGVFQCGEAGTGPRARFTVPGTRIDGLGATPSRSTIFVSERTTVFEGDVQFSHTPV